MYECLCLYLKNSFWVNKIINVNQPLMNLILVLTLHFIMPPASTKLKGGILVSPCLSVPLWTESCPLCIFHNTSQIHFIFAHLINQLHEVCRVLRFLKNFEIWIFGFFFKIVTLPLPSVHVIWMLKLIPDLSFIAATFNIPWWYL